MYVPKRKQKEEEKEIPKEAEDDNYEDENFHDMYLNEEDLDEDEDLSPGEGGESLGDVSEEEF